MPTSQQQLTVAVKAVNEMSKTLNTLQGDVDKLSISAEKASGKTGLLGTGFKTLASAGVGGALGGALGILGKQTAELDGAMAQMAAQSGLTGAQTDALKDAVLDLSGGQLQSQKSIAATVQGLISLQGVSADNVAEVEGLTQKYLDFATATGQDAATAVASFDDLLDAWNLTAADAGGIMDQLVVSHQKFGTSIEGAQGALNKLAPALQVLGLDMNTALGYINLFAASGIDAESTSAGFNKALGVLSDSSEQGATRLAGLAEKMGMTAEQTDAFLAMTPDQKFKTLAEAIAKTEEPAKTAEIAIELFGARAGPKMADALKTSAGDLDQFKVSVTDAGGKAEEAANKIENSFTNKLKLLKTEIMANAQSITADFAPALMLLGNPAVTGAIGALGGAFMTPPIGLLVILVALGVAIYLFRDQIKEALEQALEFVLTFRDKAGEAFGAVKDKVEEVFNGIKTFLADNWQEILGIALLFLTGPGGLVFMFSTNAFGIRDTVVDAIGAIPGLLLGLVSKFLDAGAALAGAILDGLKKIGEGAADVGLAFANAIIGTINSAIQMINKAIPDNIPLPGPIPDIDLPDNPVPSIPYLAAGGIVRRPTLAVIGDSGPEAVIPLSRAGLGGGIVINISAIDGASVQRIIPQIVFELRRELRRELI